MKIGIVGLGIVGNAIKYGFEKLGHQIEVHDIKLKTKINNLLTTEICFICVPTPSDNDGRCDISIVESVVAILKELDYKGIIAIKSTVVPGTTVQLRKKYDLKRLCFVPEFLRERCSITDFTENHDVCIIGTNSDHDFGLVKECHGKYPKKFVHLSETEAELCKYFNNIYNATLITFANSFYEVCKSFGVSYTNVKNAVVNRDHINDIYLDCNESFRGFGGMCLPKDTKAIAQFCRENGIDVNFFDMLLKENSKYKTTVFDNMRT